MRSTHSPGKTDDTDSDTDGDPDGLGIGDEKGKQAHGLSQAPVFAMTLHRACCSAHGQLGVGVAIGIGIDEINSSSGENGRFRFRPVPHSLAKRDSDCVPDGLGIGDARGNPA